ncbi:MAG: lysostaphin resistance A-like protein [Fidelibacterota bacterium]
MEFTKYRNNDNLKSQKYPKSSSAILIIIFCLLFALIVSSFFAVILKPLISSESINKILLITGEIFLIIPAFLFAFNRGYPVKRLFRLNGVDKKLIGISFVSGFALTVFMDEIDRFIQIFFPIPEWFESIVEVLAIESKSDFIIIIFGAVILASFIEEMLFRGFLQKTLENYYEITKAVLLASIIFALIHLNIWWIIQIYLLSVLLGYMAYRSDSIVPGSIVHIVNNGLAVYFSNIDENSLSWYLWKGHVSPLILILSVIIVLWGYRSFNNSVG